MNSDNSNDQINSTHGFNSIENILPSSDAVVPRNDTNDIPNVASLDNSYDLSIQPVVPVQEMQQSMPVSSVEQ